MSKAKFTFAPYLSYKLADQPTFADNKELEAYATQSNVARVLADYRHELRLEIPAKGLNLGEIVAAAEALQQDAAFSAFVLATDAILAIANKYGASRDTGSPKELPADWPNRMFLENNKAFFHVFACFNIKGMTASDELAVMALLEQLAKNAAKGSIVVKTNLVVDSAKGYDYGLGYKLGGVDASWTSFVQHRRSQRSE